MQRHSEQQTRMPVCVDLDGTLIEGDTLLISSRALVARNPTLLLAMAFWLLRGRAHLKEQIARRAPVDASRLRYRPEVLDYIRERQVLNHPIVLITGANWRTAECVAGHLRMFAHVFGSDGCVNLRGKRKREILVQRFGARSFVYLGNSRADLAVWKDAAEAVCVDTPLRIVKRVRSWGIPVDELKPAKRGFRRMALRSLLLG